MASYALMSHESPSSSVVGRITMDRMVFDGLLDSIHNYGTFDGYPPRAGPARTVLTISRKNGPSREELNASE